LSEHAFVKTPVASFFIAGAGAKNIPKNCPQQQVNGKLFLIRFYVFVFNLYHCYFLSTNQDIGWEEDLENNIFCVECDIKP